MSENIDYSGLRVLDLSQGIAGPYCATLLAQQGAAVIKVEPPEGDWGRTVGAARGALSAVALVANNAKRSIALDARRPEARAVILDLAARSDVLVQNYRPGVIERLGLDYESVAARQPSIVYVSITGFGPDGPDSARAATDSVLQSLTGLAWLNRDANDVPRRLPLLVPDMVTAVYAAQAVGAALYAQSRSGLGRHVRLSLMEACAAIQAIPILDEALFPGARTPLTAPSGVFRTADGWLTLVAVNEATFRSALRAIDLATLIEDERFAQPQVRLRNADALNQAVERRLTEQTLAHWVARLTEEDALFAPVQDYSGLREMEQAKHAGLFAALEQPPFGAIRVPRPPGATAEWSPRPAPAPGADADSVLAELGFDRNRIAALEACGALHRPGTAARMNG